MRRLCAVLLLVVVVVMSMVPVSQAGTITLMFHYHKTGHDLILSIAKSLVARRMVRVTTPLPSASPSHLWACHAVTAGGQRAGNGPERLVEPLKRRRLTSHRITSSILCSRRVQPLRRKWHHLLFTTGERAAARSSQSHRTRLRRKATRAHAQAVVPDGWKFSFLQGRHGWQHPNVSAPKEPAHWAAAHRTPGVNRSEITMQCLRWGQLERHLREPSRQLALMSPRPVLVYTSSPDFACPDAASHWGAPAKALPRVIHFVRDPWTMAVSSFLYHNQERTPERFVGRFMRPCAKNDLG
jgi:hypothetical protein